MTAPFSTAPCDRGIATAVPHSSGGAAHPAKTLAATILGSSLAFVDGSVVNVGLPAIGHDLGADGATVSWLVNAYLLPQGALVLFGAVAGDRWGRRRCFLAGVLVFTLASLTVGAASPAFADRFHTAALVGTTLALAAAACAFALGRAGAGRRKNST